MGQVVETTKHDNGKVRYELLPPTALEELARAYTYGAAKYEDHNWRKGTKWSRFLGALLRHVWAWARGESFDPESGHHHLAHAAFSCLTLIEYEAHGIGEDDRVSAHDDETVTVDVAATHCAYCGQLRPMDWTSVNWDGRTICDECKARADK